MSKRKYPTNVIEQSQDVLGGWNQFSPVPAFGTMTAASFSADVSSATALEAQIIALEAQLTDKRNVRDAQFAALWDKVKRVRNSVKGTFGDDSSQYEMVGGKRLSDRKPSRRKATS
jgi:hypothetical protein